MIQTIMMWWRTRNPRADAAEERQGYQYAAGVLLDMGELGAEELQDMLEHGEDCHFNQGVERAIATHKRAHGHTLNYGSGPAPFDEVAELKFSTQRPPKPWPTLHEPVMIDWDRVDAAERGCRS